MQKYKIKGYCSDIKKKGTKQTLICMADTAWGHNEYHISTNQPVSPSVIGKVAYISGTLRSVPNQGSITEPYIQLELGDVKTCVPVSVKEMTVEGTYAGPQFTEAYLKGVVTAIETAADWTYILLTTQSDSAFRLRSKKVAPDAFRVGDRIAAVCHLVDHKASNHKHYIECHIIEATKDFA